MEKLYDNNFNRLGLKVEDKRRSERLLHLTVKDSGQSFGEQHGFETDQPVFYLYLHSLQ
ncbi:hypothetical protein [Chryseobacterium sp.]|uniref:hypothetical protein n=1 Tax=Chryseobacterium sp. TaxID=1871047 RepID=UPI0026113E71|nr:hypothetical protein [Chryseobacterium sp.]